MSRWDAPPPLSGPDRWMLRNLRWLQLGCVVTGVVALVFSIVLRTWTFVPTAALCWGYISVLEVTARRLRRAQRERGTDLDV